MTVVTAGLDQITEQFEPAPPRQETHQLAAHRLHADLPGLLPASAVLAGRRLHQVQRRPLQQLRVVVRQLQFDREHPDGADRPGRRLHPLGGQHVHLRRGQRRRRRVLGHRRRLRLRQVPVPGRSRAVRHHPRRHHDPCRGADRPDLPAVRAGRPDRHLLGDHLAVAWSARSACS